MLQYKLTNQMSTQQVRGRAHSRGQKNRFMIKVRLSSRENQENREEPPEADRATDEDATLFITYMIDRSSRLSEMIERRGIYNKQAFTQKHLLGSVCLKTILKQILDKMMADRRLGKNLKGMNKSNLQEIENGVWNIIEREASLYLAEIDYNRQRKTLMGEINARKQTLMQEIQRLSALRESQQDNFMLTSSFQQ